MRLLRLISERYKVESPERLTPASSVDTVAVHSMMAASQGEKEGKVGDTSAQRGSLISVLLINESRDLQQYKLPNNKAIFISKNPLVTCNRKRRIGIN